MSVGLDIGSYQIRCLRNRGEQLVARSSRSLYAALPDAPSFRALLESGRIPFATCEGALTILGDNAAAFSPLFHVRAECLLPQGHLPTNDPVARQSAAALVEALLGEPDQPGEMCCFSLPGGEVSCSRATIHELEFFSRLIRLRGFTPQVLSSGMAAVLANLVGNSFTGIGLSFGAATSELVLAHRGLEVATCSSPRGGDWLDELIADNLGFTTHDSAGATILDLERATTFRHSFAGSVVTPHNEPSRLLNDIHYDLTYALIRSAAVEFAKRPHALQVPQPLPVIVVGAVARIAGFRELLWHSFQAAQFPLAIRDLRLEVDDTLSVARGCLINAQLETEVRAVQRGSARSDAA